MLPPSTMETSRRNSIVSNEAGNFGEVGYNLRRGSQAQVNRRAYSPLRAALQSKSYTGFSTRDESVQQVNYVELINRDFNQQYVEDQNRKPYSFMDERDREAHNNYFSSLEARGGRRHSKGGYGMNQRQARSVSTQRFSHEEDVNYDVRALRHYEDHRYENDHRSLEVRRPSSTGRLNGNTFNRHSHGHEYYGQREPAPGYFASKESLYRQAGSEEQKISIFHDDEVALEKFNNSRHFRNEISTDEQSSSYYNQSLRRRSQSLGRDRYHNRSGLNNCQETQHGRLFEGYGRSIVKNSPPSNERDNRFCVVNRYDELESTRNGADGRFAQRLDEYSSDHPGQEHFGVDGVSFC